MLDPFTVDLFTALQALEALVHPRRERKAHSAAGRVEASKISASSPSIALITDAAIQLPSPSPLPSPLPSVAVSGSAAKMA